MQARTILDAPSNPLSPYAEGDDIRGLGDGPVDVAAQPPGSPAGRKAIAQAWSEPPSYGVEVVYKY
jgi:hypothetical protein